ncbi:MAG: putative adhesin [Bacteroidota bacterium]|jgi:hypothetical protein
MKVVFIVIFCLISLLNNAQKRDRQWPIAGTFPDYQVLLDFNNGNPDTSTLRSTLGFFLTNASICDTAGNLLFYTNGQLLYNRFHQPMMNSNNFNPGGLQTWNYPYGQETEQAASILPNPVSSNLYDIFHISGEFFTMYNVNQLQPLNLMHTVIDMNLDSGKGGITSIKNEVIISDTLSHGGLTAVKHANGRDWWVMIHGFYNSLFYKALLTPYGISVSSQVEGPLFTQDAIGSQLVFTKQGDQCVLMQQYPYYDLFDFDRCSGDLIFKERILAPDTPLANVGVAFSPNGRYLYRCSNLNILQYDTYATNVSSTCDTVAQWDGSNVQGFNTTFFMMQLAPDNKIYVSTFNGTNVLHVINSPDSAGMACNVVQQGLVLPWYNAFSMPNHTNYELGPIDGSACDSLGLNNVAVINQSNEANSVTVFPNPSASWFNFLIQNETVSSVAVYNLFGEVTVTSTKPNINLSGEPSGVYLYRVKTRSGKEFRGKLQKL